MPENVEKIRHPIVIVRHGPVDYVSRRPHELTEDGRMLARLCAESIRDHVGDVPCVVLTSRVERAMETGAIIGEVLGAPQEAVFWLHVESGRPSSSVLEEAFSRRPEGTVLILVTHQPQIASMGIPRSAHCTPYYREVVGGIYGPNDNSPENQPVSVLQLSVGNLARAFKDMKIVTLGDLAGWTEPQLYECGLSDAVIDAIYQGLDGFGLSFRAEY